MTLNRNKSEYVFTNLVIYFGFFYYYLGSFKFLSVWIYVFAALVFFFILWKKASALNLYLCVYLIVILVPIFYLSLFPSISSSLVSFRFFFGSFLLIPALIFIQKRDVEVLTKILIFITLFEKLSIFFIPELINYLPNYTVGFSTDMAGFFIGVNSFGGGRSNTSVIFISLGLFFYFEKQKKISFLCFLMSILAFSASGLVIIYMIFILVMFKRVLLFLSTNKISYTNLLFGFCAAVSLICLITFIFNLNISGTVWDRLSFDYVILIVNYKIELLMQKFGDVSASIIFFGRGAGDLTVVDGVNLTGNQLGDFVILDMAYRYGIFGVMLFGITLIYLARNKKYRAPIICLLLGSLHYFPAFSMPGQILIAALINLANKER